MGLRRPGTPAGRRSQPHLRRAQLPSQSQRSDDDLLPFRAFAGLLKSTAASLERRDFGLRLSQHQGLTMLGPIAVVARSASTLAGAFDQIGAFLHLHSPALGLWREESAQVPGGVRFGYGIREPGLGPMPQTYELSLANGMQIVRLLAGPQASPELVAFRHSRAMDAAAYEDFFGGPVRFGSDWSGIELSAALAGQQLDSSDPAALEVVSEYLATRIPPGQATTTDRCASCPSCCCRPEARPSPLSPTRRRCTTARCSGGSKTRASGTTACSMPPAATWPCTT